MAQFTEKYLEILNNNELGLKEEYEFNEALSDNKLIFALENAIIAIKKEFGYARNEKIVVDDDTKTVIDHCVIIGKYRISKSNEINLKDYVKCLEQIKKSVKRHSQDGRRGYYDFVKNYV